MKKLVMLAATMALAIPAPLAVPAAALAAANPNVTFCKEYVGSDPALDPDLNRGECVSYLTTLDNYYKNGATAQSFAVHYCDYLRENYPDDYAIYASNKDCIEDTKTLL